MFFLMFFSLGQIYFGAQSKHIYLVLQHDQSEFCLPLKGTGGIGNQNIIFIIFLTRISSFPIPQSNKGYEYLFVPPF